MPDRVVNRPRRSRATHCARIQLIGGNQGERERVGVGRKPDQQVAAVNMHSAAAMRSPRQLSGR
jgi:hypothetical protein